MDFDFQKDFYKNDDDSDMLFNSLVKTPNEKITVTTNKVTESDKTFLHVHHIQFKFEPYDKQSKKVFKHFINNYQTAINESNEIVSLPDAYYDDQKNNLGFISSDNIDEFIEKLCSVLDYRNVKYKKENIISIKHSNKSSSISAQFYNKSCTNNVYIELSY